MKELLRSKYGNIARFLLFLIGILCFLSLVADLCYAEEEGESCWVLCNPDSYVALRTGPSKHTAEFGGAMCGAELRTNGRKSGGFLWVYDIPAEYDTGWINSGYIVYDEPHEVFAEMTVRSDGRVAIRKSVGGKIKSWAQSGDRIYVLWMSNSWAVTNRGYMMSKFLVGGDSD